jgi:hypothetical protein
VFELGLEKVQIDKKSSQDLRMGFCCFWKHPPAFWSHAVTLASCVFWVSVLPVRLLLAGGIGTNLCYSKVIVASMTPMIGGGEGDNAYNICGLQRQLGKVYSLTLLEMTVCHARVGWPRC